MINVTINNIKDALHVSYKKAKRLLDDAKESNLFVYDSEHNSLTVSTFKSKEVKHSRKGFKYCSDYVYKLDVRADYTLKDMYTKINKILVEYAINSKDRDDFNVGGNGSMSCPNKAISQRKLSNLVGIHRTSISRLTKQMANDRSIKKSMPTTKLAITCVNEYTVKEWKERTGRRHFIYNPNDNNGYIVLPCEYSLSDRRETEKFAHVIYNNKKRISHKNYADYHYDLNKGVDVFKLPNMALCM